MKRATVYGIDIQQDNVISIHALVKRATAHDSPTTRHITISIHALVKRATQKRIMCGALIKNFNPRPREEGDL